MKYFSIIFGLTILFSEASFSSPQLIPEEDSQKLSTFLSQPDLIILAVLQQPSAARQVGGVCRKLERLRSDQSLPLWAKLVSHSQVVEFIAKPYPLSHINLVTGWSGKDTDITPESITLLRSFLNPDNETDHLDYVREINAGLKYGYETLACFWDLRKLDIGNFAQNNTGRLILQLHFLEELLLPFDLNVIIPDNSIKGLSNLKKLTIRGSSTNIGPAMPYLTRLKELHIDSNTTLAPECVRTLTNIESLNCGNLVADEDLLCLPNLTNLMIGGNTRISGNSVTRLTNLTRLNLYSNQNIDDQDISALPKLRHLDLQVNQGITDQGLRNHANLISLNLIGNKKITDEGICHLTNLRSLVLCGSKISGKGLEGPTNLTELDLSSVSTVKDETLMQLTQLKKLALNETGRNWRGKVLKITNASLSLLVNLTDLDLDYNDTITDEGILPLTNLFRLSLRGLSSITDQAVMNLPFLGYLDLDQNSTITQTAIDYLKERKCRVFCS